MLNEQNINDFRCGHNFPFAECPYKFCGFKRAMELLWELDLEAPTDLNAEISKFRRASEKS